MKITEKWLQENYACADGISWFRDQKTTDAETLIQNAIKTKDKKILKYANWGIGKKLKKMQRIKYIVYAAEQVINIYETAFPGDERPRNAIKAAKRYIKNPTDKNAKNAAHATCCAANAASAIYANAVAVAVGASNAANAAAFAGYAISNVVACTGYAASYASKVADIKTLTKILRYGLRLIKGENK